MHLKAFARRTVTFILAFALAALAVHAKGPPAGHTAISIDSGGVVRQALVHLPPGFDRAKPLPLVVMLHGGGGTAANAVRETGWSAKADSEGFVVVYPDATRPNPNKVENFRSNPQTWNDGSGRFHSGQSAVDDVAFIRTLLERMAADYGVDKRKVFVTGFSNGASMAFRVGAELSDRVGAIAPVAGASWVEPRNLVHGVSLHYMTGTADPLNPLNGGVPKTAIGGRGTSDTAKPPVAASIASWTQAMACAAVPTQDVTDNGVRTRHYGTCRNGAYVSFVTVEGLGHIWAGGENLLPEFIVGKPTDKVRATDIIWKFFITQN